MDPEYRDDYNYEDEDIKKGADPERPGSPFLIVTGAILIVFVLSFVPWGDLTNKKIKDFNLVSDLFPGSLKAQSEEVIDPGLSGDEAAAAQKGDVNEVVKTTTINGRDTVIIEKFTPKPAVGNVGYGSNVSIEDYTYDGSGLKNLRQALTQVATKPVRIAVIGDSYIEGDIFTMDLRESFQNKYGGGGVGYVPMHSVVAATRGSVTQKSSNGWVSHRIGDNPSARLETLQGEYFTSNGNASSTFDGTYYRSHLLKWDKTMLLATAPKGGTVTVSTNAGSRTVNLPAEDKVQAVILDGNTTTATVSASGGVNVLGLYLDKPTGVSLDNMSLRGYAGGKHQGMNIDRATQMRDYADYSLIVVEYGINALESSRKDYSGYKTLIKQVINRLKESYPKADILVLGIGDRGQKVGTSVKSLPTAQNMVNAQRDAARETGVLFWDTRAAMGGEDAILDWRERKMVNEDYIHMNAAGGKELAKLLFNALQRAL